MKLVIQRVAQASVSVDQKIIGSIQSGFLILVGFTQNDSSKELQFLTQKLINLRVFADEQGKMNKSILDIKGEILAVSQFTLYADCNTGRRPSFLDALEPESAKKLYLEFVQELKKSNLKVETGIFGANMSVQLTNDGPLTFIMEKKGI